MLVRVAKSVSPSPLEICYLLIGVVLVYRYAWILDDGYVYFRYIDNWLIHNSGLVYNPGEMVEGFSSPFWTIFVAALRALHLNYWHILLFVGWGTLGLFWWLTVIVNRSLADSNATDTPIILNLPAAYLLCNYAVLSYFTSGVETPLVLLMGAAYAAAVCFPANRLLMILIGLGPMIRHELAIPYAMLVGWLWYRNQRLPWPALLSGGLTLGGYVLFRIWYYADIFPLTFYLKDQTWWAQGWLYLLDTTNTYYTGSYLVFVVAVLLWLARSGRQSTALGERLMMLALAFPVLLYVIRIGGDPRHFRYLAFPFVLIILAGGGLLEALFRHSSTAISRGVIAAMVLLTGGLLSLYPAQLSVHPLKTYQAGRTHDTVNLINDAAFHRSVGWSKPFWFDANAPELPYNSTSALSWYAAQDRYSHPDNLDTLIVENWCKTAYLMPAAYVVHDLGLTEPFLARTRTPADRPAHKFGLQPLAEELKDIRLTYGFGPGALQSALNEGYPSAWLTGNEQAIAAIEQRVFNQHDFLGNLKVLFSPSPEIVPAGSEPPASD